MDEYTADETDIPQDAQKVSDEELIEKYQKHFDKNVAMKLLVKLRKSTRNKPKAIAGTAGAVVLPWKILQRQST